ncbi:MAG: TIGR01459 family HAD-type hydrolase [Beijerinckiaceae bacterium]|jgi:HAD superfamily hydrolase (TIGR01459 family)|nr:TIGR01459 family HAD-type hydrolase [Beijerinckiaceae bacterium]
MVKAIASLADIAGRFEVLVFDQWGVLHDGTRPYPGAVAAVEALAGRGVRMAVLSNSGKRSAPNRARIAAMGFPAQAFEVVMTSGEALWRDMADGHLPGIGALCPIAASRRDAEEWLDGLGQAQLVDDPARADAVLLMGLADAPGHGSDVAGILAAALARGLPVLCSNPDKASPRAGGIIVSSPGALAEAHAAAGGRVLLYGKPHGPVFAALQRALHVEQAARLLMIGDSPEHDIAGAHAAGWASLLVRGGLHAAHFRPGAPVIDEVARLCAAHGAPLPDFTMAHVSMAEAHP